MRRIQLNPYLSFLIIFVVGAGATALILNTIKTMEASLPPSIIETAL